MDSEQNGDHQYSDLEEQIVPFVLGEGWLRLFVHGANPWDLFGRNLSTATVGVT